MVYQPEINRKWSKVNLNKLTKKVISVAQNAETGELPQEGKDGWIKNKGKLNFKAKFKVNGNYLDGILIKNDIASDKPEDEATVTLRIRNCNSE